MAASTRNALFGNATEGCMGCRVNGCPVHGEAVQRGEHVHVADVVREEKWRAPLVPGVGTTRFIYPCCGGADGCGAIFMRDHWYPRPVEAEVA